MKSIEYTSPEALTYEDFAALARDNYSQGGMEYVECWDALAFQTYVDMFGAITRDAAFAMFAAAHDRISAENAAEEQPEELTEPARTFPRLTAAVNAHYDAEAQKLAEQISTVTAGEYARIGQYRSDILTAKEKELLSQCDPAEPIPAKLTKRIISRRSRAVERARVKRLDQLLCIADHAPAERLTVEINWTRNPHWGMNPTARAYAEDADREQYITVDRASGCGYDKASAATAGALNANPKIMRILYDHAENGGTFAYSVHTFAGLPSFDGGCGMSCFRSVFEGCGYDWRQLVDRPKYDLYIMTRKEI